MQPLSNRWGCGFCRPAGPVARKWATRRQVAEAGLALLCDGSSNPTLELVAKDLSLAEPGINHPTSP